MKQLAEPAMAGGQSPYSTFLGTADLACWSACLREYRDLLDGPTEATAPQVTRFAEAICISIYVQWLGSLCGETALRNETAVLFECFADRAETAAHDVDEKLRIGVMGVVAAGKGYHATARKLLEGLPGELSPEHALLVIPASPAKRALMLKPYLFGHPGNRFLPAFYFYAHSLLDLGYMREVHNLLREYDSVSTNSLWIDLKGKLFELDGSWSEARDVYLKSAWTIHQYRSVICDIISGGTGSGDVGFSGMAQEKLKQGMLTFGGEIDQAELARSESFVNACRWNDFDSWLVSYELGKLSFRRRRHAEAEKHLKIAAEQAPQEFSFAVSSLRFVNLTWLGRPSITGGLEVNPETLECARRTLAAPGEERQKASIRNFIARATGETELLDPVAESGDPYELGDAHFTRGNTPDAIQCWCSAIREAFVPRAFHALMRQFADFRFEHTVRHLAEVVMLEAWDDFFELWELGNVLLKLNRANGGGVTIAGVEEQLSRLEARLPQLAESDFQHLIRAFEFYWGYGRPDIATSLLGRAERLAESPEEYLQLAAARRNVGSADREVLGLDNLLRAEKESRDRLERLQVARELFHYRQVARARRVLKTEGVLDRTQILEPMEYVVVLECGEPCLSADELKGLAEDAREALVRDLKTGLYPAYGHRFVERLREHTSLGPIDLQGQLDSAPGRLRNKDDDSVWRSLKYNLKRLQNSRQAEEEKRILKEKVEELEGRGAAAVFFGYTLWGLVFSDLDTTVEGIKRIRPDLDESLVPISRSDSFLYNVRARRLSELWRGYLTSDDAQEKARRLQALRDFEREERELTHQWEASRQRETERPALRAGHLAEVARQILASIRSHEAQESPWPSFLGIRECIIRDTEELALRLSERLV